MSRLSKRYRCLKVVELSTISKGSTRTLVMLPPCNTEGWRCGHPLFTRWQPLYPVAHRAFVDGKVPTRGSPVRHAGRSWLFGRVWVIRGVHDRPTPARDVARNMRQAHNALQRTRVHVATISNDCMLISRSRGVLASLRAADFGRSPAFSSRTYIFPCPLLATRCFGALYSK